MQIKKWAFAGIEIGKANFDAMLGHESIIVFQRSLIFKGILRILEEKKGKYFFFMIKLRHLLSI
jgi:hypothetical protein